MAWELKYGTLQFETELSTLGLTSSPLAPTDKRVVRATSIPTLAGHNVFITTPIGIRVLPVIVDEVGGVFAQKYWEKKKYKSFSYYSARSVPVGSSGQAECVSAILGP